MTGPRVDPRVGGVGSTPSLAYADGPPGLPLLAPDDVVPPRAGESADVLLGWTVSDTPWLADLRPGQARSMMGGYALTPHIRRGAVRYLPLRLGAMPALLAAELRPEVLVVRARPRGSGFTFASGVGWACAAARAAREVVVALDPDAPDLGGPDVPGNIGRIVETSFVDAPASDTVTELDLLVGRHVATLIPPGATVQYGPGAIGAAVMRSIEHPVSIWSGLVTDDAVALAERGLLQGAATAAYLWGTAALQDMAVEGRLHIRPVEQTHDFARLLALPAFTALNTALQVGLDGSVAVDTVGGRVVAGIGGHADFCAAASLAADGLSVIALRSERAGVSNIVHRVDSVSTARSDVDCVVTEHGVADLRGLDDDARARALIGVAAPHARDHLLAALGQNRIPAGAR